MYSAMRWFLESLTFMPPRLSAALRESLHDQERQRSCMAAATEKGAGEAVSAALAPKHDELDWCK